MSDHARGCEGRNYQCSCGYDAEVDDEIERLTRELADAREALRDFRDYILKFDGDAVLVGGAHHNPIWPRIAEQIARLDAEGKE